MVACAKLIYLRSSMIEVVSPMLITQLCAEDTDVRRVLIPFGL